MSLSNGGAKRGELSVLFDVSIDRKNIGDACRWRIASTPRISMGVVHRKAAVWRYGEQPATSRGHGPLCEVLRSWFSASGGREVWAAPTSGFSAYRTLTRSAELTG